jgi:hypothetical protein
MPGPRSLSTSLRLSRPGHSRSTLMVSRPRPHSRPCYSSATTRPVGFAKPGTSEHPASLLRQISVERPTPILAFSGAISFVEKGVKFAVVRFLHAERSRLPSEHSRKEDREGDHRCCRGLRDLSACTIRPTLAKLGNLFGKPLQIGPFVQTSSYIWSYNAQPVPPLTNPLAPAMPSSLPRADRAGRKNMKRTTLKRAVKQWREDNLPGVT